MAGFWDCIPPFALTEPAEWLLANKRVEADVRATSRRMARRAVSLGELLLNHGVEPGSTIDLDFTTGTGKITPPDKAA